MKKRLIFGLSLLLSSTLFAQTEGLVSEVDSVVVDSIEQHLPWPNCLQVRLDSMMRDPLLDYTQLGLMVWDLTDDRPLFSFNKQQLMRPASTMKLLTAITALDRLGGNYQYRTSLYYKGEIVSHTLKGDLYCVGGMDPAFDAGDLRIFADALKQVGVDTISGSIVTDISLKDTLKWGEGWCWDDDNPDLSPLLVGRKTGFVNRFSTALAETGITLDHVTTTNGVLPSDAVLVCERKRSIDYILQRMMKDSDNLYAESMFYQIAASSHRPGRANDAARVERALIERAGLNSSHYRIADGSGLSLYNYLSPELEVSILRYTFKHQAMYEHLLPSLPIAGEDGTLKKRMKEPFVSGKVRAKTGTLSGVSSLAGYVLTPNYHMLAFCIINQGIVKHSDGRGFQDRVCEALCK